MKICVLGNSHVAALKDGWNQLKTHYTDFELRFFASPGDRLKGLQLVGRQLVPNNEQLESDLSFTSHEAGVVNLDEYDAYLIYGLYLKAPALERRLSLQVKRQTCQDSIFESLNVHICSLIRRESNAPIFSGLRPQLSRDIPESSISLFANYSEVVDLMKTQLSIEVATLLAQPFQTLSNGWNTNDALLSRRPLASHPQGDFCHMNGEYGRIYLEKFFHLLRSDTVETLSEGN